MTGTSRYCVAKENILGDYKVEEAQGGRKKLSGKNSVSLSLVSGNSTPSCACYLLLTPVTGPAWCTCQYKVIITYHTVKAVWKSIFGKEQIDSRLRLLFQT